MWYLLNIKLIEFLRRSFVGLNDLEKGRMLMYNFMLAFVICGIVYFIGEAVSNLTKAWVPSVFVTAAVLLVGYWTIIPTTLISDSMLIPFGSTIGIYLLITHMGTVISIKQLVAQWKTIVVCLAGLAGMLVWGRRRKSTPPARK